MDEAFVNINWSKIHKKSYMKDLGCILSPSTIARSIYYCHNGNMCQVLKAKKGNGMFAIGIT